MDANSQKIEAQINAHVARAQSARESLGQHYQALRHKADFPARVKEQIRSRPALFFGVAALGGLSLARLFRRPKNSPLAQTPKKSLRHWMIASLFTAARPTIQTWLASQVKKYIAQRLHKAQYPTASSQK
jgi:hypothetical protein